jgi:alkanesulfonate monooxygenase SsuD/methylene tetrahydromethanopterin reductase-like flavin-dependent oxidoreductase (luciferase family)
LPLADYSKAAFISICYAVMTHWSDENRCEHTELRPGTNLASLERWAQLAETLGYHFGMISNHVAVHWQYPAPFYDPFIALAWFAGATKNLELGATS